VPERFSLLPNARTSIASLAATPQSSDNRLRFTYDLQVTGQAGVVGNPIALSGEIRGPGDISGIDPQAISRVEPGSGLKAFEPSYMPFMEFVDADFPCRYSLSTGTGNRVLPWIVLLALRADEFEFVDQVIGRAGKIRVLDVASSLPDLSQSWAFAHVQVALPADENNEKQIINQRRRSGFSRLLCPRRLAERETYYLFLVPSYEAGRQAALGIPIQPQPFDQPAWSDATSGTLELPIYRQNQFRTSAMEDVESLARRLKPIDSDQQGSIGHSTDVDASNPGYYAGYSKPGATFAQQAALMAPNSAAQGFNTDDTLVQLMIPTLEEVIKGETDDNDEEDPLVAFPPYGWRFKPQTNVSSARAGRNQWFDRVNLDLKFRHAAGDGSRTVAHFQDPLLSMAWQQYDEVLSTNRTLSALAISKYLTARLLDKHFDRLPTDIAVVLSESLQAVVKVEDSNIREDFRKNGTPATFASRALRRQSAKRTVKITNAQQTSQKIIPAPLIPGDSTSNSQASSVTAKFTADIDDNFFAEQGFAPTVSAEFSQLLDTSVYSESARPRRAGVAVQSFSSQNYAAIVSGTLSTLPMMKMKATISGLSAREQDRINPIFRSPQIPVPMSRLLTDVDKEALLSDADKLPRNSVSFFVENRRFIESFMVGANHQINNALRFSEFPCDMRGTVLRQFWDRGNDNSKSDIPEIHKWRGTLGNNFSPDDSDRQSNVVVVIKGDIIRKLGQVIVVLNIANTTQWVRGQGKDHEPAFSGQIDSDTAYYGFDVSLEHIRNNISKAFFVMYEPAGRLRFGLDIATTELRRRILDLSVTSTAFPVRAFQRDPGTIALQPSTTPTATTSLSLDSWDQFSWNHVRLLQSDYVDFTKNISIAGEPNYWGANKDSASVARSFWQKPLGIVFPMNRIL